MPDEVVSHTFATPADFSVIGPYNVTIITSMPMDTSYFNDTLRVEIRKLTRFDAGIADVEGIDIPLCQTDFMAEVLLKNYGEDTLTSVDIIFSINGGPETTINWTGSLEPGAFEYVPIASTDLLMDDNTLTVYTQNPNGMTDEDMSNDLLERDFEYISEGVGLRLELLTDNYPFETSWELYDDDNNLIFTSPVYSDAQTLYTENWCIAEGCYTFVIYDSWGDGIQFGGVQGNYQIILEETDEVLAELMVPNFGDQESNYFCTEVVCMMTLGFSSINESSPGAEDGTLIIEPFNGTPPYQYSIDGGMTFSSDPLFSGLAGGTYDVVVIDALDCSAEATAQVWNLSIGSFCNYYRCFKQQLSRRQYHSCTCKRYAALCLQY